MTLCLVVHASSNRFWVVPHQGVCPHDHYKSLVTIPLATDILAPNPLAIDPLAANLFLHVTIEITANKAHKGYRREACRNPSLYVWLCYWTYVLEDGEKKGYFIIIIVPVPACSWQSTTERKKSKPNLFSLLHLSYSVAKPYFTMHLFPSRETLFQRIHGGQWRAEVACIRVSRNCSTRFSHWEAERVNPC